MVLADSAHSIGATYNEKRSGALCDASVFSFHSVKNITTGEGGAVCLNFPEPFDNSEIYNYLKHFHLYGQTKSAQEKTGLGKWRYDIVSPGMKANMNDVSASIGLSQLRRYESDLLPHRKSIVNKYQAAFSEFSWATCPVIENANKHSSAHLFMLRFNDCNEDERDQLIAYLSENRVGVSVHYIPMAMLTYFKGEGYDIRDYPKTYELYANEITLPVYNSLSDDQTDYVIEQVIHCHTKVKNS